MEAYRYAFWVSFHLSLLSLHSVLSLSLCLCLCVCLSRLSASHVTTSVGPDFLHYIFGLFHFLLLSFVSVLRASFVVHTSNRFIRRACTNSDCDGVVGDK